MVTAGEKVGASEATLLNMLKISPFSYGLIIQQVYDSGTIFSPEVLDITNEDLCVRFMQVSVHWFTIALFADGEVWCVFTPA